MFRKLLVAKIIHSFFEVSSGEVKAVLRFAAKSLTWVNFSFALFSAVAVHRSCLFLMGLSYIVDN